MEVYNPKRVRGRSPVFVTCERDPAHRCCHRHADAATLTHSDRFCRAECAGICVPFGWPCHSGHGTIGGSEGGGGGGSVGGEGGGGVGSEGGGGEGGEGGGS